MIPAEHPITNLNLLNTLHTILDHHPCPSRKTLKLRPTIMMVGKIDGIVPLHASIKISIKVDTFEHPTEIHSFPYCETNKQEDVCYRFYSIQRH